MKERTTVSGHPRSILHRWWVVAGTTVALSLVGAAGVVTVFSTVTPDLAGAATTCSVTHPVHVHYVIGTTKSPTAKDPVAIAGITISTLPSTCNGLPAKVLFSGNTTGSSATSTHLLSTATSSLDPCTQAKASKPPTVSAGSITLDLCPTPGPGSYVSIHDVTHLTLTIAGTVVTVTPTTSASSNSPGSNTGSGSGSNSGNHTVPLATAASTGSSLAFTGADIAAMTVGGLLVILLGLFLLLVSRRRRAQSTGDTTP